MSWIASIFIAVLTAALGLFAAGLLANAAVGWYRISSFEGGSGYFVVGIALLGGFVGLIVGIIVARVAGAGAGLGFLKSLGLSLGSVAVLAGLAALPTRFLADVPPEIDGEPLDLLVEVRLPAGDTTPPASRIGEPQITLGSLVNHRQRRSATGEVRVAESRLEDGRWIVPGVVPVFTSRGLRTVGMELGGKEVAGFLVPLPARPGRRFEEWSGWLPRPPAGSPAWPDSKPSYRFRVQRQIPPPPPPDPGVAEAAEFAALDPDGPLDAWLRFLQPSGPADRLQAVMEVVERRQPDLADAIRSDVDTTREAALYAVTMLTHVTPEVSKAVLDDQREILGEIRRFNVLTEQDEGYYELGNELRTRFNYWHRAWWTVHRLTGVDGRPPVQEVLDLARVHPGDGFMQEIEVNGRAHLDGIGSPEGDTP
jgi:hypothetical protein